MTALDFVLFAGPLLELRPADLHVLGVRSLHGGDAAEALQAVLADILVFLLIVIHKRGVDDWDLLSTPSFAYASFPAPPFLYPPHPH